MFLDRLKEIRNHKLAEIRRRFSNDSLKKSCSGTWSVAKSYTSVKRSKIVLIILRSHVKIICHDIEVQEDAQLQMNHELQKGRKVQGRPIHTEM